MNAREEKTIHGKVMKIPMNRQDNELLASVSKALVSTSKPGMSMNELAKAVGVSRPTLYYHFADKNEIVSLHYRT